MAALVLETSEWARQQFEACELGDARRNKRLIKMAQDMAEQPDAGTPDQMETWKELKAGYRLLNEPDVTPEVLRAPHCKSTRQSGQPGETRLVISDTTHLDYTSHRKVRGLGPIGNGKGRGILAHTALMVDPATNDVQGIASQELFLRKARGKNRRKHHSIRCSEDRESAVWGRVIDEVGPSPAGVKWIHVCDRGADDIEVFYRIQAQGNSCVIRASRLTRKVRTLDGRTLPLKEVLPELTIQGEREVDVPATDKHPARVAKTSLRFGTVELLPPKVRTPWMKRQPPLQPVRANVVQLIELDPPKGTPAIHWILLTFEMVTDVASAFQVIDYYKKRWIIEDFHKCWKTGCSVESRRYETCEALKRIATILAIIAVRLLQLRTAATQTPERPAEEVAPVEWVETLKSVRNIPKNKPLTIRDFFRHLAGLGGFLMRKGDGEPGWITLWRGLEKLILILRGVTTTRRRCG